MFAKQEVNLIWTAVKWVFIEKKPRFIGKS